MPSRTEYSKSSEGKTSREQPEEEIKQSSSHSQKKEKGAENQNGVMSRKPQEERSRRRKHQVLQKSNTAGLEKRHSSIKRQSYLQEFSPSPAVSGSPGL